MTWDIAWTLFCAAAWFVGVFFFVRNYRKAVG